MEREIKISVITPTIRPDGLVWLQDCLKKQSFKDFEWLVEVGLGVKHDLNQAYNRMLKRAKGELIVFYQDWIEIPDNGLQVFWEEYQKDKNYFITAPVGKKGDDQKIKWDWRAFKYEDCGFQGWEIDWGCASKEALFKVGGFDEELDKNWSFDNVVVAYKAQRLGYKFKCIENKSVAYDHDKYETHPFREKFNPTANNQRLRDIDNGAIINYLNNNTQ